MVAAVLAAGSIEPLALGLGYWTLLVMYHVGAESNIE